MDFVETEGDTIDEAIGNALKQLGVAREKVTVDILSEGRKGIFGFGSQKARIRAALRKNPVDLTTVEETPAGAEPKAAGATPSETAEKAQAALQEILRLMGFQATVERHADASGNETILEIRADNSALLIGRKGQTLEALQYLVTRIAGERPGSEEPHIVVDVENYRARRRKTLEDMALRLGEKAKRQRKTVTVDALSAADRRIIHAALQDDPWVSTKSLGQGVYRRLLIIPEGDRRKKEGTNPSAQEKPSARAAPRSERSKPVGVSEDEEPS
jgi:spoIIIJ-associated protein